MRAREVAARLPKPDALQRFSLSIAALDAVLSPESEYRYFSFDPEWSAGERLASMRNGSGDAYFVVFADEGVVVRAFDHESELSPWVREDGTVAPGILDGFPVELRSVIDEPAFRTEGGPETDLTFCAWWLPDSAVWQTGPTDDDGGAADLLEVVLQGTAAAYRRYAVDYFEVEPPIEISEVFVALDPVDGDTIARLDPTADGQAVLADLAAIGYPVRDG